MSKLQGKVALVTGGSSGLGLATAKRFVEEGAFVFITGRRQAELDAAVAEIGSNVRGVQGDVSNLADLDRLYEVIKAEKGTLDVVFANAGVSAFLPLGHITEEHVDQTFGVNVKGLIFTVQKALPLLKDGSSVILMASMITSKAMDAFSVYAASKAAVRNFARGFTQDLRPRKIRVNAVSPGLIPTPAYAHYGMSDEQMQAFAAHMTTLIPAGRVGEQDEIAKAVVFLASDDSSYMTGAELVVDGGLSQV